MNQLQNAHVVRLATRGPLADRQYGVYLVNQGADFFQTPNLHLEVQLADDLAITAIEAAGSTVECAYYDIISKMALIDPVNYFLKGRPIDKRQLPTQDLYKYYSDPKKRGYLADDDKVKEVRDKNLKVKFGMVKSFKDFPRKKSKK